MRQRTVDPPVAELAPERCRILRRRLLAWFDRHATELPWRRRSDAYSVWLSEVMLQQTQVDVVVPYFERFRRRFPTVAALAAADVDQVLELWQGLGYYGRARRLLRAAQAIMHEHRGEFPRTLAGARALPGVGRYTAGAVLSIAYGERLPAVDGNVARVLARWQKLPLHLDDPRGAAQFWVWASQLVPAQTPGWWNQALMELGRLVCTKTAPHCSACPVVAQCFAAADGSVASIPPKRRRRRPPRVEVAVAWLERRGRVAVCQRRSAGVLADFWELPETEVAAPDPPQRQLAQRLVELGWDDVTVGERLAQARHAMFNRQAAISVYACTATQHPVAGVAFVDPSQPRVLVTTATRKVARAVAAGARR